LEIRRKTNVARIALVTGGARGIGAAISTALQQVGRHVTASYTGNTAVAEAFSAETGSTFQKSALTA
jgi:acetoacetyl-CoA reductase